MRQGASPAVSSDSESTSVILRVFFVNNSLHIVKITSDWLSVPLAFCKYLLFISLTLHDILEQIGKLLFWLQGYSHLNIMLLKMKKQKTCLNESHWGQSCWSCEMICELCKKDCEDTVKNVIHKLQHLAQGITKCSLLTPPCLTAVKFPVSLISCLLYCCFENIWGGIFPSSWLMEKLRPKTQCWPLSLKVCCAAFPQPSHVKEGL